MKEMIVLRFNIETVPLNFESIFCQLPFPNWHFSHPHFHFLNQDCCCCHLDGFYA